MSIVGRLLPVRLAAVRVRWFPWDVRVDDCVRVTLSSVLKFRNEIFECGS